MISKLPLNDSRHDGRRPASRTTEEAAQQRPRYRGAAPGDTQRLRPLRAGAYIHDLRGDCPDEAHDASPADPGESACEDQPPHTLRGATEQRADDEDEHAGVQHDLGWSSTSALLMRHGPQDRHLRNGKKEVRTLRPTRSDSRP